MSEEKKKALWVDEDTHTEVAVMAARKKVSIKKFLKELVERERVKQQDKTAS
jgi:predicted HicB family RNase H-like nuclease